MLLLFKISHIMDFRLFLFLQNHSYLQRPNFTLAARGVARCCRTGRHPQLHRQDIASGPAARSPKLGYGPRTTPDRHRCGHHRCQCHGPQPPMLPLPPQTSCRKPLDRLFPPICRAKHGQGISRPTSLVPSWADPRVVVLPASFTSFWRLPPFPPPVRGVSVVHS